MKCPLKMSSHSVNVERSSAETIVAVFWKTTTWEVLSINLKKSLINIEFKRDVIKF